MDRFPEFASMGRRFPSWNFSRKQRIKKRSIKRVLETDPCLQKGAKLACLQDGKESFWNKWIKVIDVETSFSRLYASTRQVHLGWLQEALSMERRCARLVDVLSICSRGQLQISLWRGFQRKPLLKCAWQVCNDLHTLSILQQSVWDSPKGFYLQAMVRQHPENVWLKLPNNWATCEEKCLAPTPSLRPPKGPVIAR